MVQKFDLESKTAMNHRWIKLFLLLYLPYAVFVIGGGIYTYLGEETRERERIESRESVEVDLSAINMQGHFESVFSDLTYLITDRRILGAITVQSFSGFRFPHFEEHLVAFLGAKPDYEKVRWIDASGRERIRIEQRDGKVASLTPSNLQNKQDRPYFREAMNLAPCERYVSPLDLQVEHGHIVRPLRPLIRVAATLHNPSGHQGIAIINFDGRALIDSFLSGFRGSSLDHAHLLDSDGHWLRSPDSADDFANQLGQERSFELRFPEAWRRMTGVEHGQFFDGRGLWTFRRYLPTPRASSNASVCQVKVSQPFIIVSHVPQQEFDETYFNAQVKIGISVVLLLLGGLIGSVVLTHIWLAREDAREQTRRLGERNLLLTNLGEGVMGVDDEGRCSFANKSAEILLGQTSTDMVGQPISLLLDWRDENDADSTAISTWFERPQTLEERQERSGRIRLASGTLVPVWLTITRVPSNEGHIESPRV